MQVADVAPHTLTQCFGWIICTWSLWAICCMYAGGILMCVELNSSCGILKTLPSYIHTNVSVSTPLIVRPYFFAVDMHFYHNWFLEGDPPLSLFHLYHFVLSSALFITVTQPSSDEYTSNNIFAEYPECTSMQTTHTCTHMQAPRSMYTYTKSLHVKITVSKALQKTTFSIKCYYLVLQSY